MVKSKPKKRIAKPEWYQTRPIYVVGIVASLLLAYEAAVLAIDTANMFAYTAALLFVVLAIHYLILLVRSFVQK